MLIVLINNSQKITQQNKSICCITEKTIPLLLNLINFDILIQLNNQKQTPKEFKTILNRQS